MIWGKQMYPYRVNRWLDGDPGSRAPNARRHGRNAGWRRLDALDILAMPDPWEYPWFAAWDLGFHIVAVGPRRPGVRQVPDAGAAAEWFQHPNGALPAYEWNFDDVNPPVHVLAALRVYAIDGGRDRDFLERVFQKLLINFTWWLNRRTRKATTCSAAVSSGWTTSAPSTARTCPRASARAGRRHGLDGVLLHVHAGDRDRLAEQNPVYEDMVVKFLEHFLQIARALEQQGLGDERMLSSTTGSSTPRASRRR